MSFSDQAQSAVDENLVFPSRLRRRLRVGLNRHLEDSRELLASSVLDLTPNEEGDTSVIQRRLLRAQREIVDEEIFTLVSHTECVY